MKTYHQGAREERAAILRQVKTKRTKLYKRGASECVLDQLDDLILWIQERKERYAKKKGGL